MKDENDEKDFAKYHTIVEECNNKCFERLAEHALRNP